MHCKKAKREECVRNAVWEMKGDLGQRSIGISYTRYLKKCVTQIYGDLHGDAVLVPNPGTNRNICYRVLLQKLKFIA